MKTKKRKLALKKNTVTTLTQSEGKKMQGGDTVLCKCERWTDPSRCFTWKAQ
jgi:hypothetical protein